MLHSSLLGLATLASASTINYFGPAPAISWRNSNQTAIVILDTPGYPLWIKDLDSALQRVYRQDESQDTSILLNLTMSHNHKTLLMNGHPIVPFSDPNVPSKIEALQVRASIHEGLFRSILNLGLNKPENTRSGQWTFVELDYDILVWSDPLAGPWGNNVPRLRFRVMGMGAHGKNETVKLEEQKVLHVELTDMNHGQSDDPKAWFEITDVQLMDEEESYRWPPATTKEMVKEECTTRSWRCADEEGAFYGLNPSGAPYYRWIWRERFDEFGRKGSLRHNIMEKIEEIKNLGPEFYWKWIFMSIIAMSSVGMAFLICAFFWLKWKDYRAERRVESEWDDRLLGEKEGAGFEAELGLDDAVEYYDTQVVCSLTAPVDLELTPEDEEALKNRVGHLR